jgi:hypothetical protein
MTLRPTSRAGSELAAALRWSALLPLRVAKPPRKSDAQGLSRPALREPPDRLSGGVGLSPLCVRHLAEGVGTFHGGLW